MILSRNEMTAALELRQGKKVVQKFLEATVAVCGLGGLGSNIAVSLARAGVGKLILIDHDCVDITNLHRQHYKMKQVGQYKTDASMENINEIAPYTELQTYNVRITESNAEELLADADIICEAFDDPEAKAMLANIVLEKMSEKYLVAASGMAGLGSANSIKTRKIMKRFYLCGDEVSDIEEYSCLFAPRVMLCAAHQAHMVLRILAGESEDADS